MSIDDVIRVYGGKRSGVEELVEKTDDVDKETGLWLPHLELQQCQYLQEACGIVDKIAKTGKFRKQEREAWLKKMAVEYLDKGKRGIPRWHRVLWFLGKVHWQGKDIGLSVEDALYELDKVVHNLTRAKWRHKRKVVGVRKPDPKLEETVERERAWDEHKRGLEEKVKSGEITEDWGKILME